MREIYSGVPYTNIELWQEYRSMRATMNEIIREQETQALLQQLLNMKEWQRTLLLAELDPAEELWQTTSVLS
jgi:hypothetical protein